MSSNYQNKVSRSKITDCLLYTSDAADERSSVDLGGRRIIKKKNKTKQTMRAQIEETQKIGSISRKREQPRPEKPIT